MLGRPTHRLSICLVSLTSMADSTRFVQLGGFRTVGGLPRCSMGPICHELNSLMSPIRRGQSRRRCQDDSLAGKRVRLEWHCRLSFKDLCRSPLQEFVTCLLSRFHQQFDLPAPFDDAQQREQENGRKTCQVDFLGPKTFPPPRHITSANSTVVGANSPASQSSGVVAHRPEACGRRAIGAYPLTCRSRSL